MGGGSKKDEPSVPAPYAAPPTNVQVHPKDSEIIMVRGHDEKKTDDNNWSGNLIHAPGDTTEDKDQPASQAAGAAKSDVSSPDLPPGCERAMTGSWHAMAHSDSVKQTFDNGADAAPKS